MKKKVTSDKLKVKSTRCCSWWLPAVLVILFPFSLFAQADIHFSQFYETSILRNPALTAVFPDDYKFGVYYRSQWSSISNPYVTVLGSAETRISVSHSSDDFLSFGLLAYSDKAGSIDQKITGGYPAINFNKCVDPEHNSYLSVGFTGGYLQYSFDPSKVTVDNQYQNGHFNSGNPSLENFPDAKMNLWDLGAGVNFNTSSGKNQNFTFIIGFAGYHFTQPNFSYYHIPSLKQNMRWNLNVGISGTLSENISVQGHGNYARQGSYSEIMIGGLINWTAATDGLDPLCVLTVGAFYRTNDAIIPVIKIKYKKMALGVSYDLNNSTLQEASKMDGGYEVTLFIMGDYSDKGIEKKKVCPKF